MELWWVFAVSGVALGALLALCTLTAIGARRRGVGFPVAVAAGVFFPISWTVWYLRDEQPYRRAGGAPVDQGRGPRTRP